jgi:hypothetical protein
MRTKGLTLHTIYVKHTILQSLGDKCHVTKIKVIICLHLHLCVWACGLACKRNENQILYLIYVLKKELFQ